MYIKRNEHFGITYMLLDRPSPLSLRVKSKKADIFLLRKHDVIIISKAYPRIWKLISEKAFHNMIAIKNKTFATLKSYCSCYGLTLDNKYEPKKTPKLDPLSMFEIKELMELEKVKKEEEKIQKSKNKTLLKKRPSRFKKRLSGTVAVKQKDMISKIKNNLFKKYSQNNLTNNTLSLETPKNALVKMKSFQPAVLTGAIQKLNYKDMKMSKIIENDAEKDLNQFKLNDSTNIAKEDLDSTLKEEINAINKKDLKFSQQKEEENEIKEKEDGEKKSEERKKYNISDSNSDLEKTNIMYNTDNDISYPNTLNNLPPAFASFLKKRIIKKKIKDKTYYKLMCLKLIETLNTFIKNSSNNIKIDIENINNNITSINNYNLSYIKDTNNYSNLNILNSEDLISSFSKKEKSVFFDMDRLAISKNDSFEFKSIYNNLNAISNGKYEKNKIIQKETEEFVLYYSKDINGSKLLNAKNNSRFNLCRVKKDGNFENSFSMLIGNLSEIKSSNSIIIPQQNSPIRNYKTTKNVKTPATKSKKSGKKNKKLRNKSQKNVNFKNFLDIDNFNLDQGPPSTSQNNISENSENKIIKSDKSAVTKNNENIINFGDIKPKTFINKYFKEKKTKKEKIDKSQSKESLNKFNILSSENGLTINRNIEGLKIRTLDKLKTTNKRGVSKTTIEENKKFLSEIVGNKNCNIY